MRLTSILPFIFLVAFTLSRQSSYGQKDRLPISFGAGLQVYPAGEIYSLNAELFRTQAISMPVRIAWNSIDRQDFSSFHFHESGYGVGGSIGYRRTFWMRRGSWVLGLNYDLWYEKIEWENSCFDFCTMGAGTTYVWVFQPWLQAGYFTNTRKTPFQFGISLGFGREINTISHGDKVAEDWILSGALQLNYVFKKK